MSEGYSTYEKTEGGLIWHQPHEPSLAEVCEAATNEFPNIKDTHLLVDVRFYKSVREGVRLIINHDGEKIVFPETAVTLANLKRFAENCFPKADFSQIKIISRYQESWRFNVRLILTPIVYISTIVPSLQ